MKVAAYASLLTYLLPASVVCLSISHQEALFAYLLVSGSVVCLSISHQEVFCATVVLILHYYSCLLTIVY